LTVMPLTGTTLSATLSFLWQTYESAF